MDSLQMNTQEISSSISGEGNWEIKEAEGGQFLPYVPFWTIDEFSIKKKNHTSQIGHH